MFVFFLPAGQFEITRVQISQGPFRSIAQISSLFSLSEEAFVSIGIWVSARIRELTDGWLLQRWWPKTTRDRGRVHHSYAVSYP